MKIHTPVQASIEYSYPESTTEAERQTMAEFRKYRRTNIAEMRPYISGEDLSNVSVSAEDDPINDNGMIARNPQNHKDQWYVARKYFEDNFEIDEHPR